MGSMITLGIEKMEIDWGKNHLFHDHSPLFQKHDIKLIPYYYVDRDTEKSIIEMKEGYSKKLSTIKHRLDLMGYIINSIAAMFKSQLDEAEYYESGVDIVFEQYYHAIYSIDLNKVDMRIDSNGYVDLQDGCNGYDFGEYARKCVLNDAEIAKHMLKKEQDKWDISYFLENIDPYITLRILAENPVNKDFELQWRFTDVVEGGWVKREDIVCALPQNNKILIVTEGTSDSFVIKKAIDSLYPDISDFFDFIDMQNNYPFTGVGNLYNFCMGLAKIKILNNILVIFDNDTAGIEKYELSLLLNKPRNLHICRLPNHDSFNEFKTIGPSGEIKSNINGKAVAIECFLDFNSISDNSIYVRWTSYSKGKDQYQGELFSKDELVRTFKSSNLCSDSYDVSKLKYLIDYLIGEWIENQ